MPAIKNFTLYRGTAPTLRFTMTSKGSILGQAAVYTMRREDNSPDPVVFEKTATIFDAGSLTTYGVWIVPLTKIETLGMPARDYAYSFERTDEGAEDLFTKGVATVENDVTNEA